MDISKNKLIGLSCIIVGIILILIFNYFYQYAITGAIYYMISYNLNPPNEYMINLHLTSTLVISGFILIIIGTGLTFKKND